ncbi:helix-turn-helix domain-containing protein [Priestia megaterium]|uniref:helix-turn-helix domain-containing protein n=1 Tax=Priestia megaterium TaxID=1404 RepID=UPI0023D9D26E|nr:helix-turn-helix transcriptional regulator [Priestia megaterium]MDF2010229.1 helix-turn-helix transcriptional regulator [Priestia megaterium]
MKKRKNINDVVNETIEQFPSIKMVCKLEDHLANLGMTLRELSLLTGIRYASLNEMKNGKKVTLNLQHVLAVMVALRIKNLNELFDTQFDDPKEEHNFCCDSDNYRLYGMPDSEFEKIKENAVRLEREDELKR